MADFSELTESGKHRAITEAQLRADVAESKLERLRRYLFGALLIIMDADEIMLQLIKRGEKKKK